MSGKTNSDDKEFFKMTVYTDFKETIINNWLYYYRGMSIYNSKESYQ